MKGDKNDLHRYDDIIELPHHVSESHLRMSAFNRAAQFSSFAALTGYDDAVKETARLTDKKIELDETAKALLDEKLRIIGENIYNKPEITITYFVPDENKAGGAYVTTNGFVKKLDGYDKAIVLQDGTRIVIDDIINIRGEIIRAFDDINAL